MKPDCSPNLVRFATTLARRLGVNRRTINRWLKIPGAPTRINGRWDVWDWIEFLDAQGLYSRRLDRCCVALNVAALINERLPERVSQTTERILLEAISTSCLTTAMSAARSRHQPPAPNRMPWRGRGQCVSKISILGACQAPGSNRAPCAARLRPRRLHAEASGDSKGSATAVQGLLKGHSRTEAVRRGAR